MAPEPENTTPHSDEEYASAVEWVVTAIYNAFRIQPEFRKASPLSEKGKRELIRNRRAMESMGTVAEKRDYLFRPRS